MAGNTQLTADQIVSVKTKLTDWGLLDPLFASEGDPRAQCGHNNSWGVGSVSAAEEFLKLFGTTNADGVISEDEATLILSKGDPQPLKPDGEKAKRIVDAYQKKKWYVARGSDCYNVLWVRNINRDWTEKKGQIDAWDDLCILWQAQHNGTVRIIEEFWQVTSQPGLYYTQKPCNSDGCATVVPGQYKAWQRGMHGSGRSAHEGFRQEGRITVYRDSNRDGFISGEATQSGVFYCNWHSTVGAPEEIGRWSAGCSVFRFMDELRRFMHILEGDRRYRANKAYMFIGAYLLSEDLEWAMLASQK